MSVTIPSAPSSGARARTATPSRAGSACLRVLIGTDTYPPDVNGASFFTARLAAGLAERGSDVHLLCPAPDGRPRAVRHGDVLEHRLRSVPSLVHDTVRLAVPLGVPGHVDRLLARLRPDVVHLQNHFVVGRLLLRAARRHGVPVVATNHFMPENMFNYLHVPVPLRNRIGRLAWRDFARVLAETDHVTTPTRTAAQLLVDQGLQRPVEAVSCGIDTYRFRPMWEEADGSILTSRARFRAHFGVPDRPTFAFVGRLDEEKHIEDLVSAVARITVDGAQLLLAGTGAQRRRLERLAADEGVADRVHFLGFVSDDDLPLVYRAADVFAIAGTAELQSIATLEALASGLPVVAADAMALPHLIEEGHNGYLYRPGDIDGLAARLSRLLASPEERAEMGAAGRAIASRHRYQRSLVRFEQIYHDLTGSPTASTG
ncbi:glycosyltransferase [Allosalinactinospora lopnorensis]|uniref:glycosyltransferase n=1 Tax=Allosalinactinospora lopnorensis TaxID=1352348 RepID=UPI000623D966|nr:glycosyltransferase [Allosalinactinospora lopnorensis]